ncbi:ATP-grasp domain-containing protein [Belliella pelovolcani]|uniref:ATP-grasp domain-containing protein n=1 Tax=Belliella pelovolcani TaxID=529505 RepID=A0A1N7LB81_9BACT|nr:ATP-grasp domain-containing protein [Belliella pelovolcani]SIS71078.1 ATP-grasp domain-containing protein [Belliella pelovolcani]
MILLDYPFVSDFLLETIEQFQYPVVATQQAKDWCKNRNINFISEKEAEKRIQQDPKIAIYTNSENSISWVQQHAQGTRFPELIDTFKNKFRFRKLVSDIFPDYYFRSIPFSELKNINPNDLQYPLIVKPAVGFFSIAVHKVDRPEDWNGTVDQIIASIASTQSLYPKEVIDNTDFIIEAYIKGEEYAFDCYFDKNGEPVILNILHHVFISEEDVSDRWYYSSEEIINKLHDPLMDFLKAIGEKLEIKNFPLHIEVRVDQNDHIIPIEVNPMRFGGWCTTADLTWFAYGINSYQYFFESRKPDWEAVFKNKKDKKYSLILLDKSHQFKREEIESFDYEKIAADFENPIHVRRYPLNEFGVFGFLFTETSKENEKELHDILHSDLEDYIIFKKEKFLSQ